MSYKVDNTNYQHYWDLAAVSEDKRDEWYYVGYAEGLEGVSPAPPHRNPSFTYSYNLGYEDGKGDRDGLSDA